MLINYITVVVVDIGKAFNIVVKNILLQRLALVLKAMNWNNANALKSYPVY